MSALEFIVSWGWPIPWIVSVLTFIDAWQDHLELSNKINTSENKERKRVIFRRRLKWAIPIIAIIGAVVTQVEGDIYENKVRDLEAKNPIRVLSKKQSEIILNELNPSSELIYFIVNPSAPDIEKYTNDLAKVLTRAGCRVMRNVGSSINIDRDITITPKDLPGSIKLKNAFIKSGIKVRDGYGFSGGMLKGEPPPDGAITIYIGMKSMD